MTIENGQKREQEVCEELAISGVRHVAWKHPLDDFGYFNGSPEDILNECSRVLKYIPNYSYVSVDGIEFPPFKEYSSSSLPHGPILEGLARKECHLLAGDFIGMHEQRLIDNINSLWGKYAPLALPFLIYPLLSKLGSNTRMSRREFLKLAGKALAIGVPGAYFSRLLSQLLGGSIASKVTENANSCELGSFLNQVYSLPSEILLPEGFAAIRPALVIIKQKELGKILPGDPQFVSVWGTSHLKNQQATDRIRRLSLELEDLDKYRKLAWGYVNKELNFFSYEKDHDSVIEQVAGLMTKMCAIGVFSPKLVDNGLKSRGNNIVLEYDGVLFDNRMFSENKSVEYYDSSHGGEPLENLRIAVSFWEGEVKNLLTYL